MAAASQVQTAVTTSVTELTASRARVAVRVMPEEIEAHVQRAAGRLGRELKLPGFRKGKVPAPIVLRRLGRDAVLEQAVRDGLAGWYAEAIRQSRLVPIGDPKIDLGQLPDAGQPLELTLELDVLPKATLGDYRGLEVPRREPAAAEEEIDAEIEAMRERLARLQTVTRPAATADFVVVDYRGELAGADEGGADEPGHAAFAGGEGRDQLVELGAQGLIPGFSEGLLGASAGETREIDVAFPADHTNERLAGRQVSFQVTVKEVKHKQLPELDEDFAIDAGFDDVQELREDIRTRLLEVDQARVQEEFREAALDAAVEVAQVPVTSELAQARAREMWERMLHSLAHRGISREAYLRLSGRDEAEILAEMVPEAERALRREAVLTAVVEAEAISPSEQDLLEAVQPTAQREGSTPERLLGQLRDAGRLEEAREDVAARQAVDLIADAAEPIPVERAQAREKLWTPEKDEQQRERDSAASSAGEAPPAGRLWTPGS
ncbi:MAG TPA: trigger factor [Solirubrobacteraceae bacterium]|nr:trigger factor [Solirubrobacteraceae bacterium]